MPSIMSDTLQDRIATVIRTAKERPGSCCQALRYKVRSTVTGRPVAGRLLQANFAAADRAVQHSLGLAHLASSTNSMPIQAEL
jgi:hypothetical protein